MNPIYAPLLSALAGAVIGCMGHEASSSGRFDIIEFWAYIAIVAAVSVLSLAILDTNFMQE